MAAIRSLLVTAVVAAAVDAAAAQSPQDMKDGAEMMVGVGAICADYLHKPEVLEQMRRRSIDQLLGTGMSEAEANAFMDKAAATARADPSNETQMQVACEMVGIKALPQP